MKTKELIRRLQEADPSGEEDCCVGRSDILFVAPEPGYYDRCFQVLKREPNNPYYNVIGAEIKSSATKIKIVIHDIEDALIDHPELPITFDSEYSEKHWEDRIEQWRQEYRQLHKEEKK